MIYGTDGAGGALIIAAADSAAELEALHTSLAEQGPAERLHAGMRFPGVLEMLQGEDFSGFERPPLVLEFPDSPARARFAARHGVEIVGRNQARSRQQAMLRAFERTNSAFRPSLHPALNGQDPNSKEQWEPSVELMALRGKTIGETYGIEEDDPWDRRTDEEKARLAEQKKKLKETAEKGGMTKDSFGGENKAVGAKGGGLVVTGVTARELTNGVVQVSHVEAWKDSGDPSADDDSEDRRIVHTGPAALFHRVNVRGAKLAQAQPVLLEGGLDAPTIAVDRRNDAAGCWIAVLSQRHARRMVEVLEAAGIEADTETVNRGGESVLPKGTTVVEADDPASLLRPWNDAAAWGGLSDERRAEEIKGVKGDEFLVCGGRGRATWGCDVWIAPRAWFRRTKTLHPEPLSPWLGALLPPDLEEIAPGYFRCKNREWVTVSHDLARRGFKESVLLQVAVNVL